MICRCKCGNKYEYLFYNAGMCIHCLRVRKKLRSLRKWKLWFNVGAVKKYREGGEAWVYTKSGTNKLVK